jgi:hypothetical protein
VIWWVRGEEPTTLGSDYAALAVALGLLEKNSADQLVLLGGARRWLAQNSDWLLVFDNVRDSAELLDYLPQSATGHVLATSRNPNWRGVAQTLPLSVLSRPESVALLVRRTAQENESEAAVLAKALGDLPLALEQAGAYIEATRTTIAEYVTLFFSRRSELWPEEHAPSGYSDTVGTTWNIGFERVRAECPSAEDLLNLCAFLAPNDIPRPLLVKGAGHLPGLLSLAAADPLVMNRTVQAVVRYSLMQVADDALSVHPLVQTVTRDRLGEAASRTWIEAAVLLVNAGFPAASDDVVTWSECSRLLSHALVSAARAASFGIAPAATASLLNRVGHYLKERADFASAKEALERALAIDEAVHGPNSSEVCGIGSRYSYEKRSIRWNPRPARLPAPPDTAHRAHPAAAGPPRRGPVHHHENAPASAAPEAPGRSASGRRDIRSRARAGGSKTADAARSRALPDLPHFFAWPLSSPLECDEGVSSGCADGRAYFDQILDLESTVSEESDPVAVREVKLHAEIAWPFDTVHTERRTE